MLDRERTHYMAGKTKSKKKQPLDTRSKMYLVLALCSVMLLVCIGISLALIGWLPFGSAAPHQSALRTASVSALRAAFGGCAPTRACGRSPS